MNLFLTHEFKKFISERVASEFYQMASEGLQMLQRRDDQKHRSREKRGQPPTKHGRNNL